MNTYENDQRVVWANQIKLIIFPELLEKKNIKVEAIEKLLRRIPCLSHESEQTIEEISDRILNAIKE